MMQKQHAGAALVREHVVPEAAHTLQNLVLPHLKQLGTEDMYIRRPHGAARVSLRDAALYFARGDVVSFDTFFNGFTIKPWRDACPVEDLVLCLSGVGRFQIRFGLHRLKRPGSWLDECVVELREGEETTYRLPFWPIPEDGILYFSLEAIDDAKLTAGRFATTAEPVRDVKLGVVITHFNRKAYVVPAIRRIREELLSDPAFQGKIELMVVDNSQNLTPDEAAGATLIPNRNLGGSGGFTRGLMHLEDEGSFTHCLFMDDDASCEIESLKRTYALLSYARVDNFAVSGSLLREVEPYRLFEKGARFDGLCRPLKSGLDVRQVHDLLVAEQDDEKPDFGGWWLFAFALKDVRHHPFPYFVRGDDITFSMMHRFNIQTLNGITCWGEDFALKSGPLPIYLDVRNHILIQMELLNRSPAQIIKSVSWFLKVHLRSYNYATASAVTLALKHVCEGPEFWKRNIDTGNIRAQVGALGPSEKMEPLGAPPPNLCHPETFRRKKRDRKWRKLTLGGLIVPDFLLKNRAMWQYKSFHANSEQTYLFKSIYYVYPHTGQGYVAHYDRKRTIRELIDFMKASRAFKKNFPAIRASYSDGFKYLTSRDFWDEVYQESPVDTE